MQQFGQRLHVKVGAGVASGYKLDRNFTRIGQHDGAVGQGVRCNRHQRPTRQGWVEHRPARRQCVGSGARGRGNDQTICPLIGHKVAIHLDPQLDHARGGTAVDHHIVHGQGVKNANPFAPHLGMHQGAPIFLIQTFQHGGQGGLVAIQGNVGDEAQAALVDANQGHARRGQAPTKAEHRAVAAHHQGHIAVLGNAVHIQGAQALQAGVVGGFLFQANAAAQAGQKGGDVLQNIAHAGQLGGALGIGVFTNQGDLLKANGHGEITSLKSFEIMTILDDRAKLLLKALVERYIADGQPVGSRTLSRASGLELSPATIRNVMSDLEELGLIASPHTSAGRVPTARGYRLFVDTMLTVQREQLQTPALAAEQPQKVILNAAQLLSNLSHFVGVVIAPRRTSVFRHIEFLRLSERRLLLIIVSPEGDVQNRVIFTETDYSSSQLVEAANFLNTHFAGMAIEQVRERLKSEVDKLRSEIATLMQTAVAAGSEAMSDTTAEVIISGERNLLAVSDFSSDMGHLRRAFELFEQKAQLMRLLDVSSQAEGVSIFIGGESQIVPFEELSVVSSPYEVNGQVVGTLGVIGPTRMPYERMIQIVDITSRLVSNALSHQNK